MARRHTLRPPLLLILLLGAAGLARAGDIGAKLQSMLEGIPAAQVSSGILYDRVLPLVPVEKFDGRAAAPTVSPEDWRQLYHEIRGASLAAPPWPSLEVIRHREAARMRRGVVPVALMNFFYDRIRPDALKSGALTVRDGRLVPGKGEALTHGRIFAIAPLKEATYRGEQVVFRFDPEDYFSNDGSAPRSLEADFDDGLGYVPVSLPGGEFRVHYATVGEKTIRLRLTLSDGTTLQAAGTFEVKALMTPSPTDTLHITATIPYQGRYGTGDAYIDLAPTHTVLTDPVIVPEGFDLDNTMNWDELYALLNRQNLLEDMRAQGYDLVVLNFTDATDYIQLNSYALVELITQVREAIAPEKSVALIGPSMGGLVGRYALDYMEANNLPHSVRTFISFDSPQTGANIPLGMQYWLWFFADQAAAAATYLAELDSPAARQMLVYHHTDPPTTSGQADPLRGQLLGDLAALGSYPTQPRLVAVANGSGSRQSQGFNPGDMIIRWEYTSFLVDLTGDVWAVPNGTSHSIFHGLIDYIFLPANETTVNVSGTLPYDNAPGGWRSTMAQLAAVDPGYGDIVALYPNHCFIPSISSLALNNTADLFYNIAGDADLLSHTPFDAVYYPASNEEHVDINAENAPWFINEITLGASTAPPPSAAVPALARIEPPAPNPVVEGARIRYALPWAGTAELGIFDAQGRRVALLADGMMAAGAHEVAWTGAGDAGRRLGRGVYFLQLRGPGFAAHRRVVLR